MAVNPFCKSLYSSVVERQSCKLKVLGSIPSGGSCASHQPSYPICIARLLSAELIPIQHLSVATDMPKSWPALPYPCGKTVWPSAPSRRLVAAFREDVGWNPTAFIFCSVDDVESRSLDWLFHSSTTSRNYSLTGPRRLPIACLSIKRPMSLVSRGQLGWWSDVTSTHGAWKHAAVRFRLRVDGIIHGRISLEVICFRAVTNYQNIQGDHFAQFSSKTGLSRPHREVMTPCEAF